MATQGFTLSNEKWVDYLIAEYDALQRARDNLDSVISNRFNFFLAAASAVIVTLGFIAQTYKLGTIFFVVALGLLSVVLLLGLVIFMWVIESHVTLYTYIRGMNKIRRYFVEHAISVNSNAKDYFILPTQDNVPTFSGVGFTKQHRLSSLVGLAGMMTIVNSATGGALCICVIELLLGENNSFSDVWALILSVLFFGGFFVAHIVIYSKRMRRAESESANATRFPDEIVPSPD